MNKKSRQFLRERRHVRVRARIFGTSKRPRMSIFRSLFHVYIQLIDDEKQITLLSADDRELKARTKGKVNIAFEVGKLLAEKAVEKKIKEIVFDRGGYKYHGRVRAAAEGAREGGLQF